MKGHLYIIVLALLPISYADTNCTYTKCTNSELDPSPSQKEACGTIIEVGITKYDKCEILKKHNELRSHVAGGFEKRGNPGPQPAALNMKTMHWDSQLACMAQRWANNCKFAHDPCRRDDRFYYVSQNIGGTMTPGTVTTTPSDIIQKWYNEVSNMNRSTVHCFLQSKGVGQYTQIVWANTDKLGCGKIVYQTPDNVNHYYLVCNYGPGGNVVPQPVYEAI